MIVEKVVLYICSIFGHHGHSTNIHYWSESGTLRTLASGSELGPLWMEYRKLATGSEWKPFERSLPVVNWEPLERSLAVVNWELLERSLPVVNWEPFERSLPVVNGNRLNARYR